MYTAHHTFTSNLFSREQSTSREENSVQGWLRVDPILKHHESPYAAFSNNPIMLIDPDGRDTSFADNQARQDFKAAQSTVNSRVSEYQNRVNENKALANEKGIGAAFKRFFRNEKADAQKLANWQKLKDDFDRIVDPNTKMVEYSSNSTYPGASGTTQDMGSYIKVTAKAGKLDTYIHENRHVNQIYNGTTGYSSNTDWYDELEAFQYQMIYDPTFVNEMIRNSALNNGRNPDLFTLRDMISIEYKRKGYIWSFTNH